jgi:hypothetical protein
MNTFLLLWNPSISSYTLDRFEEDFDFENGTVDFIDNGNSFPWDLNWSVWEWEKACKGDRFFMLRVGNGQPNGIVMSGKLSSNPYVDEDWSRNGRVVHYVDLALDAAFHPASPKILSADILEQKFPDRNWRKGHSGQMLDNETAAQLESLWNNHIYKYITLRKKAEIIAKKAHAGQVDKAGEDYFNHPKRVSYNFNEDNEIIVAFLHDVIEDTNITLEQLKKEGFNDEVLVALDAITKRESESYDQFIDRVKENPIALKVKMADLRDNMDILRLPELTEKDLQRIAKYHKAYKYLEQFAGEEEYIVFID